MKIDFSKAEKQKDFEPIPPGSYEMKVTAVEEKPGDKGAYWELTLEVQGGLYDGKEVKDRLFFTPAAMWKVKSAYSRLAGIELGEAEAEVETDDLLGCKGFVKLKIEDREHNGKTYTNNVVAGYLKSQGSASIDKAASKVDNEDDFNF